MKKNAICRATKEASSLTRHIFDYRMRSWFKTWNIVQWLLYTLPDTTYNNYCIHCQILNS